jgi:glycosyltransferase involved in cell wall biosynthesis
LRELVVVDDGSSTDLFEVVAPFGERVRYLRLSGNQGANAARNAGIAAAEGDAVALLDDDDRWLPDKVARQVARLAAGYEAVLCGWRAGDGSETRVHPVDDVTADMLRRGNPYCGTSGLLARRDALLAVPFDAALPKSQEWDVYVRLAQRRPLAYVRAPLYERDTGDHARITLSARHYTPEQLLQHALAVRKHRTWLGERHYRAQLAAKLLDHIAVRPAKHRYLLYAVRHAGLPATTGHLLRKTMERLRF